MKKIKIITGQTATGKTSLAIQKAKDLKGELINADSRQVYAKLDIITGKDLSDAVFHQHYKQNGFTVGTYTIQNMPLWLYDVADPSLRFSSHDYAVLAEGVITKILEKGHVPIIVGGTYLYIYHLLYGVDTSGIAPNPDLRSELEAMTVSQLQTIAEQECPEIFHTLNSSDRNNPRRLIRKIEIGRSGNMPVKQQLSFDITLPARLGLPDLEIEYIGLRYNDREKMKHIITQRVEERLKAGAVEEVQKLLEAGYTSADPGLQAIGYAQIISFLNKQISLEEAAQEWITKELQYAKRQYTFMKRDPHIQWTNLSI